MTTVSRLERLTLRSDAGESVRLGSLWEHQPVVLVFIRHFG